MNYEMDRVSIRMVKEPPLLSEKPITGPGSAIEILNDYLGDFDREVMAIVNLRTDGKPINMNIMSMGSADNNADASIILFSIQFSIRFTVRLQSNLQSAVRTVKRISIYNSPVAVSCRTDTFDYPLIL